MKICQSCRKTYTDHSLNFCLDDGSVLTPQNADVPDETVVMTRPSIPVGGIHPNAYAKWDDRIRYSDQSQRSSKAWIWVLGIFAMLALICGGGFVGFIAFLGSLNEQGSSSASNKATPEKKEELNPRGSPFSTDNIAQSIDLREWVTDTTVWGKTEFVGDEFIMASKSRGYFYVLAAPAEYKTTETTTRLTVRNLDEVSSDLGYGLVFHSDVTPLVRDLAFLIDTKHQKYRVVQHLNSLESSLVGWTHSSAIREGAKENVLEVRDKAERIELYINGKLVDTVKNTRSPKGGVAGLYTGDGVRVAFKKLEIIK